MKVIAKHPVVTIFAAVSLCSLAYGIIQFSKSFSACFAIAPRQARAVGYTRTAFCDALTDNSEVDVNNTLRPQFLLYSSSQGVTTPASAISNHGTALQIDGGALTSVAARSSVIGGNTLVGGFYAEVDIKFNSSSCLHGSRVWPSFWLDYAPAQGPSASPVRYTELDVFEWLNCKALATIHDWPADGAPQNCQNSNNDVSALFSPGNRWNRYGVLLIPSSGTGLGTAKWYYNNTLVSTVTYSPMGLSDPSSGCPSGAFATSDTQPWAFVLDGGTKDSTMFRNLHLWQAPRSLPIENWLTRQ